MKSNIKLIALDLDGTLLTSDKQLTERNYRALEAAAAKGIQIVPCTGRIFRTMPQAVRELPFVRYAICVNGAQVFDRETDTQLYAADIPWQRGLEALRAMDAYPGIYNCYMDGDGWMSAEAYDRLSEFAQDPHVQALLRSANRRVPDLKTFIAETKRDLQKMQIFFHSREERMHYEPELRRIMPDLTLTTSLGINLEINSPDANKGAAVTALCRHLGFGPEQAMCFGDGTNDLTMVQTAGIGVAMKNGEESVKAAASVIAPPCDESGVAQVIERIVLDEA